VDHALTQGLPAGYHQVDAFAGTLVRG